MASPTAHDPRLAPRIAAIQQALRSQGVDAWLFCGFRQIDPLTQRILFVDTVPHLTRRWFYLVPAQGSPRKLRHRIEPVSMSWWTGEETVYLSWKELEAGLKKIAGGCRKIAMHYSPGGAVPTVSIVDAGMLEMVRAATGAEIVSSGDLVQLFEAALSPDQIASHDAAAHDLYRIAQEAYDEIGRLLKSGKDTDEYAVQQFIMKRFSDAALVTDSPPIIGVNAHSGDPHYEPTAQSHAPIRKGDFVLVDIWAKTTKLPEAIFADITWVGFAGREVPEKIRKVFDVVRAARDAAFDFVKKAIAEKRAIHGWEVDDACRDVIKKADMAPYFIHRTGHSIGRETHGNGANIDNLETRDLRRIVPNTCFSIEPGIYLPEFGVRTEIDVMVEPAGARITGAKPQTEVLKIDV